MEIKLYSKVSYFVMRKKEVAKEKHNQTQMNFKSFFFPRSIRVETLRFASRSFQQVYQLITRSVDLQFSLLAEVQGNYQL